jgi:phenylalanyl-tRNA synthetase beta chain
MKLSLKWLRDFVDVDMPPAEFARRLTDATAEVESWQSVGGDWDTERIRVAEVVAIEPHPNADRLRLATVETGNGREQVVCGAPNLAVGQKVAFATEGAKLIDGHTGKPATLKLRPIRGVDSAGMVLSEKELGLSDDHEGILVLDGDAVPGRPLVDEIGDVTFDISTWANRADLLGVLGFAREVAVLTGEPLREPGRSYTPGDRRTAEMVEVSIDDPGLCGRFMAAVIENVTVAPSPAWMQERLRRLGMRPINNVVDITNYVMLETCQPMHAFDYDKVSGHKIVVRRATAGETLTTLDGTVRQLDGDMLLICDGEGPLSIAGIMGGGSSEVEPDTRTILLEVANFRAGSIRRTSGKLKLRTEASLRFEKGIGAGMAAYAQARALHLFETIAGGTVANEPVDVFPGRRDIEPLVLSEARIEQVLGVVTPRPDVHRILEGLGFRCEDDDTGYRVTPPYWRPDVERRDDVIEEIARLWGYEQLPSTMLRGALPEVEPRPAERLRERLRDGLAALGFQEIISYTLTTMQALQRVTAPDDSLRRAPLSVVNPVAAQHTFLRTSLRAGVLESYASNRRHDDGPLRLFEAGAEYLPVEADLPHERAVVCAVLGGRREQRWAAANSAGEPLDFFDAKGTLEGLGALLGIDLACTANEEFGLLRGHSARITADGQTVGVLGQVHPDTATAFDIDEPVFLLELWVEDLVRVLPERPAYAPPSRFPEVRQDIAVLIDEATPAAGVLAVVRSHRAGRTRVTGDVFDEYRGKGVPEGKRSLAIRLRYQAEDRTLSDTDITRIREGLLKRLEKETGATLRG